MSYRNERLALETRSAALETELAQLKRRSAEFAALGQQIAALERELTDVRARLKSVPAGRKLPLLDDIAIASPCDASWDAMAGDARVRHCGSCKKDVYNLSAMTRAEAEALITERAGNVCVRLYRRKDGTVLTQDCPVGLRWKQRRRAALAVLGGGTAAAVAVASVLALLHARQPARAGQAPAPPAPSSVMALQGDISPPTPMMGEPVIPHMGTPLPSPVGAVPPGYEAPRMGHVSHPRQPHASAHTAPRTPPSPR